MRKLHLYYIYILTDKNNSVLYTGVTNDLIRRCYEHSIGLNNGFTKKYGVHKLVYFEYFNFIEEAINREKQIKGLSREKKIQLIENINPQWKDLYNNGIIINPLNRNQRYNQ
jgi:putative endonuclease